MPERTTKPNSTDDRSSMLPRHVASLIAVAIVCLSGMFYDEGELFNNVWTQTTRSMGSLSSSLLSGNSTSASQQRILLVTYVFSKEAAQKQYLRMFLASAATAGVDLLIVGDQPPPPYVLPANVRHHRIGWDEFVSRVETKLAIDATALRTAVPYKIIDFKPLFAHLLPELVAGYEWWGHVDNDMLLGDIMAGVAPYLDSSDIISGIRDHATWGPFTLYRNSERINTLFRSATVSLQQLFGTAEPVCFDEWGQCGPFQRQKGASMSGIIERLVSSSTPPMIRVQQGVFGEIVWDGHCKFKTFGRPKHRCSECAYRHQGSIPLASRKTDGTYQPAFLCHYEYAKHRIEDNLEMSVPTMESLLVAGEFRVNFLDGFQPLLDDDRAKIATLEQSASTTVNENLRSKAPTVEPQVETMLSTGVNSTSLMSPPSPQLPLQPLRPPVAGNDDEQQPPAKILLVSYIFSAAAVNKRYVRFFAETASTSGADIMLLGDVPPPFPLPAHVRHYLISWPDLLDLSASKLNLAAMNKTMQNATMYKVNDFKPLFAHLFPDLVAGYEWWGHVDNDLLLGNVATVVARYGPTSDIISGSPEHSTWGPFTLYRHRPAINTLFQRATIPLERIFANPKPVCFDEWGSCGFKSWPGAAMSGIVDLNAAQLGLRLQRGVDVEAAWDGFCHHPKYGYSKQNCTECTYRRDSGNLLQILHANGETAEALLCHYQYAKPRLEASLADDRKVQSMLEAGAFMVNYLDGFQDV